MKKLQNIWAYPVILLAISSLVSCGGSGDNKIAGTPTTQVDSQLNEIITAKGLTGNPMKIGTPDISSKEAQLGMHLFYSKSLSIERDSACVTCHHPMLGGGDDLSLPIGTEAVDPDLLGPGRFHSLNGNHYDGGPTVPRNAPTTFNIAAWDQVMFHDGRVESLAKTEGMNGAGIAGIITPDGDSTTRDIRAGANLVQAQARFPVTSPEEMSGFNDGGMLNQEKREFLAERLGGYGTSAGLLADTSFWLNKFRDVYELPNEKAESLITEQNISFLIGQYERSQVFIDTPWKSYVEGNNSAISTAAKKGALLFFNPVAKGGADCSSCHSGDFFTDEGFHNLAMPQIGRGKGDGNDGSNDFGRFRVTNNEADKFAFRTPSLINVEATGPWTHAGSYTSLEAVIRHHLNPQNAIDNYDESQLTQMGMQNLGEMQTNSQQAIDARSFEGLNINLTSTDVNNLVAFMKALTDPCVQDRECLSRWIPDADTADSDPNGDQLNAVDFNYDLL